MLPVILSTLLFTAGDNPQAQKPLAIEEQFFFLVGINLMEFGVVTGLDALAAVSEPGEGSLPQQLLQDLQGKDSRKRAAAVESFVFLAQMAHVSARIDGKNDGARRFRRALGPLASSYVKSLKTVLTDPSAELRFMAGTSLLVLEPNHRKALQAVVAGLQTMDLKYLKTVEPLRFTHGQIVECFVEAVRHKDGHVRRAAAVAVLRIGPPAKEAVPALVQLLKSKEAIGDDFDHWLGFTTLPFRKRVNFALEAIGAMGADSASAVPALIEMLNVSGAEQRADILACLARIGPGARKATQPVRKLLTDGSDDIRVAAVCTLLRILPGDEQALSIMKKSLRSPDKELRMRALEACAQAALKEKALVPEFIRGLQQEDENLQGAAADAIAQVGPDAEEAIPALVETLMKASYYYWNHPAARALVRIGKASIPGLIKVAEQKEAAGREAALYSLSSFEGEGHRTVPVLVNGLIDLGSRLTATIALGRLGREAREASLALLIVCLLDILEDEEYRQLLECWALAQTMR